jgi:hypothetical protein
MPRLTEREQGIGESRRENRQAAEFGAFWITRGRLLALFVAASAVLAGYAAFFGASFWPATGPAVLALAIGVHMLSALRGFRAARTRPRIVPYFEASVPGDITFFSGYALVQACETLDQIARREGYRPLSDFGFADSFGGGRGEEAHWYPARECLSTIERLLEVVRADPHAVEEPEEVTAELESLRSRLQAAERLGVGFCLHRREDWAYTSHEFLNRLGKY